MSASSAVAPGAAAVRPHPPVLLPVLALTFATGVLDAATYLGLHGVFTANMTGNVVFVGLGLAGHGGVPLLRSGLALAGFALGAALLGRIGRHRAPRAAADRVAAWSLLAVAGVLAATTALLLVLDPAADGSVVALDALTVVLAAAMGGQAVAARRLGVPDVTTVVVTSTLALLASDHHFAGRTRDRRATERRAGAVLGMALGSVVGALLLRWHIAAAAGLCAALVVVVGLVLLRGGRSRVPAAPAGT